MLDALLDPLALLDALDGLDALAAALDATLAMALAPELAAAAGLALLSDPHAVSASAPATVATPIRAVESIFTKVPFVGARAVTGQPVWLSSGPKLERPGEALVRLL